MTYEELTKPGMYFKLFHGRQDPVVDMEEWGFAGPILGPLNFVHTTYGDNIKIEFAPGADTQGLDHNLHLNLVEDMIELDGNYYGDWSVFCFDPARA